jgi:hypothetical protein
MHPSGSMDAAAPRRVGRHRPHPVHTGAVTDARPPSVTWPLSRMRRPPGADGRWQSGRSGCAQLGVGGRIHG